MVGLAQFLIDISELGFPDTIDPPNKYRDVVCDIAYGTVYLQNDDDDDEGRQETGNSLSSSTGSDVIITRDDADNDEDDDFYFRSTSTPTPSDKNSVLPDVIADLERAPLRPGGGGHPGGQHGARRSAAGGRSRRTSSSCYDEYDGDDVSLGFDADCCWEDDLDLEGGEDGMSSRRRGGAGRRDRLLSIGGNSSTTSRLLDRTLSIESSSQYCNYFSFYRD